MVVEEAGELSAQHACMILCLPAMSQEHILLAQPTGGQLHPAATIPTLRDRAYIVPVTEAPWLPAPWRQRQSV